MDLDSKVRRSPQVVARELAEGEGGVLLHMETGQYHGLNPTGLAIWQLIDDGATVGDIVAGLREQVEDAPPDLEKAVEAFLASIRERDLVVIEQ